MSDLIDRQAAIDAVSKWFYDVFGIKESDGTATIFKRLRELPSAQETLSDGTLQITVDTDISTVDRILLSQSGTHYGNLYYADEAQPHWIPCSERLPDEFGEYLITKKAIGWNCEEYNSNDIAYFDNEGFHKADKVLAWMPLPKPYGGESE